MESPLGKLVNEAKTLNKRVDEEVQQTKSHQSLIEDSSVSSFTTNDIDAFHQRSIHDINLCIEKIEELSMECKSLLSVIQDLEMGNSEFLIEVGKKRKSEGELENLLVKDVEAFTVETEIKGRTPSGEVNANIENTSNSTRV